MGGSRFVDRVWCEATCKGNDLLIEFGVKATSEGYDLLTESDVKQRGRAMNC